MSAAFAAIMIAAALVLPDTTAEASLAWFR